MFWGVLEQVFSFARDENTLNLPAHYCLPCYVARQERCCRCLLCQTKVCFLFYLLKTWIFAFSRMTHRVFSECWQHLIEISVQKSKTATKKFLFFFMFLLFRVYLHGNYCGAWRLSWPSACVIRMRTWVWSLGPVQINPCSDHAIVMLPGLKDRALGLLSRALGLLGELQASETSSLNKQATWCLRDHATQDCPVAFIYTTHTGMCTHTFMCPEKRVVVLRTGRGLFGKAVCRTSWQPQFYPQKPHEVEGENHLQSCSVTSTVA